MCIKLQSIVVYLIHHLHDLLYVLTCAESHKATLGVSYQASLTKFHNKPGCVDGVLEDFFTHHTRFCCCPLSFIHSHLSALGQTVQQNMPCIKPVFTFFEVIYGSTVATALHSLLFLFPIMDELLLATYAISQG
jgi:hypothetical protein